MIGVTLVNIGEEITKNAPPVWGHTVSTSGDTLFPRNIIGFVKAKLYFIKFRADLSKDLQKFLGLTLSTGPK